MTRFFTNLILIVFFSFNSNAQQSKYWVMFTDKDLSAQASISEKCKENRRNLGLPITQISDLPVSKAYLSVLQSLDIQALTQSKWLNGISANLTQKQVLAVKNLGFIMVQP